MAKNDPNAKILALVREGKKGSPGTEGTITSTELAKVIGRNPSRARAILGELVEVGKMRRALVPRMDGWGATIRVKGFEIVE